MLPVGRVTTLSILCIGFLGISNLNVSMFFFSLSILCIGFIATVGTSEVDLAPYLFQFFVLDSTLDLGIVPKDVRELSILCIGFKSTSAVAVSACNSHHAFNSLYWIRGI